MILEGTKVEITDGKTGLVLKRTTTSEGEFLNRKIAVNNFLFNCDATKRGKINEVVITNYPIKKLEQLKL